MTGAVARRFIIIAVMVAVVAGLAKLFSGAPLEVGAVGRGGVSSSTIEAMASNWSGEIDFGAPYPALALSRDLEEVTIASFFKPADEYSGLPRSPGFEAVAGWCGACHSLAIVMQQKQSAAGWERLLSWMVEVQGMPPPPPDERAELVAYLAREFGQQASGPSTPD